MKMPQSLTVDSDVKMSAATEIHGKMSVWAAYLKIGAGIRAQVSDPCGSLKQLAITFSFTDIAAPHHGGFFFRGSNNVIVESFDYGAVFCFFMDTEVGYSYLMH